MTTTQDFRDPRVMQPILHCNNYFRCDRQRENKRIEAAQELSTEENLEQEL